MINEYTKRLQVLFAKKKKTSILDLQVGDYIKASDGKEYVLTEYVTRVHGSDQRNKMSEPNTIIYKVFDCETESIIKLEFDIEDEVEVLKNENDLFRIEYTKSGVLNDERYVQKVPLIMLAKNKSEVEERLKEKDEDIQVVRLEKLLHAKI